jgi:CheY-like chemotaxis protein
VVVSVTDNGVGIPTTCCRKVFEMFSQVGRNLDRCAGRLGIGLTLVRRLTEMHGGSVKAESRGIGTGSRFSVRIPLASAKQVAAQTAIPTEAASGGVAPPRLRVLVVDDNVDGAHMLSLLVGMHQHETAFAHNGPDALKALAEFRPQLAFVDIGLPGLNGYEVARRVRAREKGRNEPPVILVALTGWGATRTRPVRRRPGSTCTSPSRLTPTRWKPC